MGPADFPPWMRSAPVRWQAYTSVVGSASPDGVFTPVDSPGGRSSLRAPRLQFDLLAVDRPGPEPLVSAGERELAHALWDAGDVAVVSSSGVARMLLPGDAVRLEVLFDGMRRLALLVGAAPLAVEVSIPLWLPSDEPSNVERRAERARILRSDPSLLL